MLANPQWLPRLHTTLRAFFRGALWFDFDDVAPALPPVVLQNSNEVTPPTSALFRALPESSSIDFTFKSSTNTASYSAV